MNNLDTASPLLLHCPFQISPQPLLITEEPGFSEPLHVKSSVKRTIFFTPVIIKYMKKNLDITKPRYREQILPVPSTEALRQNRYKANTQRHCVTSHMLCHNKTEIKNVPSNTCHSGNSFSNVLS